jgi:hypothetical protein
VCFASTARWPPASAIAARSGGSGGLCPPWWTALQTASYFVSEWSNSGRRNRRSQWLALGASDGPFLELLLVGDSGVRGVADRGVKPAFSVTLCWAPRLHQRSPSRCRPTCLSLYPGNWAPSQWPGPGFLWQAHQPANPAAPGPSLAENGAFPGVRSDCPAYRFTRILTGHFGAASPGPTGIPVLRWGSRCRPLHLASRRRRQRAFLRPAGRAE